MCGIAGKFYLKEGQVNFQELKKMTDAIQHRGPDGEGHWVNTSKNVGFGHRRLSIIDLSNNGSQPMHYKSERYTITYNGEVYNYLELKSDLKKHGYAFHSASDTEVILALFDLKREACLHDLNGMFAFAIWDEQEQTLFCARDRFGEKPFHYYFDGNQFIFASEIKQFWALGISKKVNEERLNLFLKTGIIENEKHLTQTFFDNIYKLDAAHYIQLKIKDTQVEQKKYWNINQTRTVFKGSINNAAEEFLSLLTHSVKLRLRSDVPVGSSLSGGLDSSSIVMLMNNIKNNEVKQNTFSARFNDFEKDEGKHIAEVIEACKSIEAHQIWLDKEYFESVIDKVVFHQDEPFGSSSIVAQYAVMDLAKKKNVTVLLDGQGADEYLAGYLPYYNVYLNQLFYTDSKKYDSEITAFNKLRSNAVANNLNTNETLRMKLGRYRRKWFSNGNSNQADNLFNILKEDTTVHGLKTLLRYADRNAMAHSREVRLPFLDHHLVEFVFSLPDDFKLHEG
jgi:asparagine synthase (glutamine-hydrolysing)